MNLIFSVSPHTHKDPAVQWSMQLTFLAKAITICKWLLSHTRILHVTAVKSKAEIG